MTTLANKRTNGCLSMTARCPETCCSCLTSCPATPAQRSDASNMSGLCNDQLITTQLAGSSRFRLRRSKRMIICGTRMCSKGMLLSFPGSHSVPFRSDLKLQGLEKVRQRRNFAPKTFRCARGSAPASQCVTHYGIVCRMRIGDGL